MAGRSTIAQLSVLLNVDSKGLNTGLKKGKSQVDKFALGFNASTTAMAAGVATIAVGVGKLTLDLAKAAGRLEPVKKKFESLAGTDLRELRESTGGLLTDMELMSRTNFASNLGLNVEALPGLFKAAKITAQETGQSVDYLVDSIVTGIGRKSVKILDNLGISAIELRQELGSVSLEMASIAQVTTAVSDILSRKTSDTMLDNAATAAQRLETSFENFKTAMGQAANDSGFLSGFMNSISAVFDDVSNEIQLEDSLMENFGLSESEIRRRAKEITQAYITEFGKVPESKNFGLEKLFEELRDKEEKMAKSSADQAIREGVRTEKKLREIYTRENDYKTNLIVDYWKKEMELLEAKERIAADNKLKVAIVEVNKELEVQKKSYADLYEEAMKGLDAYVAKVRKSQGSLYLYKDETSSRRGNASFEQALLDQTEGMGFDDMGEETAEEWSGKDQFKADQLATVASELQNIRALTGMVSSGFDEMYSAIASGDNIFEAFGDMIKRMSLELAKMLVTTLVISAVFPGAFAAGGALGGAKGVTGLLNKAGALFGGQGILSLFGGGSVKGRATGGRVQAGVPYTINERGQELFVPDSGGRVIPAGHSRQMMSDGGMTAKVRLEGMDQVLQFERTNRHKNRYGL